MSDAAEEIKETTEITEYVSDIKSVDDMRQFLLSIRDRMSDQCAPVYALAAMNRVLNLSNIYDILDGENKEIARDIWLRLKQAGFHVKTPPMLFDPEEDISTSA
jgi:hypothetical protein